MSLSTKYSKMDFQNSTERQTKEQDHSKLTILGCIIITIMAGGLHSTQIGLNVLLMAKLDGQALRSSFVSFFVGCLSLLPFLCYNCKNRTIPRFEHLFFKLNLNKIEYLCFFNGLFAAFYITAAIFVSPKIGLALYFICVVTGQMLFSTLLDWAQHTLKSHIIRIFGILVLVTGVVVCEIDTINNNSSGRQWYFTVLYCLIGVLAGFASVTRSFMNRRFQFHLKSATYAASINFIGGMICCLVAALIQWAVIKDSLFTDNINDNYGLSFSNCYIWFGGCCGAIYLCIVSIIMPSYIGYVGSFICAICGNLTVSTIYDTYGVFNTAHELTSLRLFGIILVFIAVVGVNIPKILQFEMTGAIDKAEQETLLPATDKNEHSRLLDNEYNVLVQL